VLVDYERPYLHVGADISPVRYGWLCQALLLAKVSRVDGRRLRDVRITHRWVNACEGYTWDQDIYVGRLRRGSYWVSVRAVQYRSREDLQGSAHQRTRSFWVSR
jgi:hypothetical protein